MLVMSNDVQHEKAYNKADTLMARRQYDTGSLYQRSSDGRWFGSIKAGFTPNGTRKRITVSGKSKSVVQRRLRDKMAEMAAAGGQSTKRTVTVAAWGKSWLDAIQPHVRPASYETDKAAVRWITSSIGHIKLADLTPSDVTTVAAAIRKDGSSSSTALRYHGSLMRMLKAASLDGYLIAPNVLLGKKPTAAVHDRQALTVTECVKALAHLQRRDDERALLMPDASRWSLAFLQGIRQGEALGLTWDEVNLSAGTMTICWQAKSLRYKEDRNPESGFLVPDGYEARHLIGATHLVRPKSKAGWRVMPLIPWAGSALEEWAQDAPDNPHGLVWPGRTTKAGTWPRNPASDRDQWEAVQAAAGIAHPTGRPYHVHEIRHSTATLLMELKIPESIRIAIMGHSSITSTRAYETADADQIRAALQGLARVLELG